MDERQPQPLPQVKAFICPLGGNVLQDPVVALADGVTYEKQKILEYFSTEKSRCPSGVEQWSTMIIPNISLRHAIQEVQKGKSIPGEGPADSWFSFHCPITDEIMQDPVISIADGYSYERSSIDHWFSIMHRMNSPMTNVVVWTNLTIPNKALRFAINELIPSLSPDKALETLTIQDPVDVKSLLRSSVENCLTTLGSESSTENNAEGAAEAVLQSMKMYESDEQLASLGCAAIAAIGRRTELSVWKLRQDRAIPQVIACLKHHPQSVDLYENSLKAFSAIATDMYEQEREEMAEGPLMKEVVHLIVEAMKIFSEEVQVLKAATQCIVDFAYGCDWYRMYFGVNGVCEILLSILRQYPEDSALQTSTAFAIATLAHGNAVNAAKFKDGGGIELLTTVMKISPTLSPLVYRCLGAVINIADNAEDMEDEEAAYDTCEVVVSSMIAFTDDREILIEALQAIVALAYQNMANKAKLGTCGAIEQVLAVMTERPDDSQVLFHGCMALATMSHLSTENALKVGEKGGCEVVASAMNIMKDDRDVIYRAVGACINLAALEEESNRDRLGAVGICEALLRALRTFPEDSDIQREGLQAVSVMAYRSEPNKMKFIQDGGLEFILGILPNVTDADTSKFGLDALQSLILSTSEEALPKAMTMRSLTLSLFNILTRHLEAVEKDTELLALGCLTIATLAHESSTTRKLLGEIGACDLVLKAMKIDLKDKRLAYRSVGAIINLASECPENKKALEELGVLQLLILVLREFNYDRDLVHEGIGGVIMLSYDDPLIRRVLIEQGVLPVIQEAMAKYPTDLEIQRDCCFALSTLVDPAQEAAVAQQELCRLLVEAMIRYPTNRGLIYRAQGALVGLAQSGELNCQSLMKANAGRVLSKTMENFPDDRDIQFEAIQAIISLVHESPERQLALLKQRVLYRIVSALQTFKDHPVLLSVALLGLAELCYQLEEVANTAGGLGVCEAVIRAMKAHPSSWELQYRSIGAIFSLTLLSTHNRKRFEDGGVFFLVLDAMARFSVDRCIQLEGCQVLVVFAGGPDRTVPFLEGHGIAQRLKKTMTIFCRDSEVLQECFFAASSIAWMSARNTQELVEFEVCQDVVTALTRFPDDREIVYRLCEFSLCLVRQDLNGNALRTLQSNGFTIVRTLRRLRRSLPSDFELHDIIHTTIHEIFGSSYALANQDSLEEAELAAQEAREGITV